MAAKKLHTCKVCACKYTKARQLQKVCGLACALVLAKKVAEKAEAKKAAQERKATKERLASMQTLPQLVKKAQAAFNAYIRARDLGKECISCARTLTSEPNSYDAGHYRSVGSAPHLRFDEANCHGQCKYCNNHLSGNHVIYRQRLEERIGLEALISLEAKNESRKYRRDELIELASVYNSRRRSLNKGGGHGHKI